jgi:hypothetical protein
MARRIALFVAKYAAGGVIGYAAPRLLVAMGVPVDQWIIAIGRWLGVQEAWVSSDEAIWAATFILGAVLYVSQWIWIKEKTPITPRGTIEPIDRNGLPVIEAFQQFMPRKDVSAAQQLAARLLEMRRRGVEQNLWQHCEDEIKRLHGKMKPALLAGALNATAYSGPVRHGDKRVIVPQEYWAFLELDISHSTASGGGVSYVDLLVSRASSSDGRA